MVGSEELAYGCAGITLAIGGSGLAATPIARMGTEAPEHMAYAQELVNGVAEHHDRIDELIASYAEGWTLERMPTVDRNLCRIAVFERPGFPAATDKGGDVQRAQLPATDVSSTEIRAKIGRGENVSTLVPATVLGYIKAHRLYR